MGEVIPIKAEPKKLIGAEKPRIMSAALEGKSKGDEFIAFAEKCGVPLFPWQQYIARDFLSIDDSGQWIRKTSGIIISRQNGKTFLVAMRIIAGLFLWGEKSVIGMSSVRDQAEDTFRLVCEIVDRNDFLREQVRLNRGQVGYFGNGAYYLPLKNGGKYEVVASNRSGSRGKTADLLFIDELREITPEGWSAAKPVTIARPNAQTFVTSNAGDMFSTVLNELRDRALSYPSPSLGWYEYSAPENSKLNDKKAWQQANPSLGYTITEAGLTEALTTSSPEKFRTEHLCQWVGSQVSPWPLGAWEACIDNKLQMAPGAHTIFGFDVAKSRRSASLVAGQVLPDGRIGVGILQEWKADNAIDELTMARDIKAWADKYFPAALCFDRYSTASIAARLSVSGLKTVDISGQEFYQSCGELLDAIVSKRVVHAGQKSLDDQMMACGVKELDSSWRIVRKASAGDVAAPISLAMVMHKMYEPMAVPAIF